MLIEGCLKSNFETAFF